MQAFISLARCLMKTSLPAHSVSLPCRPVVVTELPSLKRAKPEVQPSPAA